MAADWLSFVWRTFLSFCTPQVILGAGLGLTALFLLIGKVPLNYNLRNLQIRWRTTALTALAFTMVVGLLVVMLAFVNGISRLTEQSGRKDNVMVLSDLRSVARQVKGLMSEKKIQDAVKASHNLFSKLDKAVKKGLLHKNKASRSKSRLAKRLNALQGKL